MTKHIEFCLISIGILVIVAIVISIMTRKDMFLYDPRHSESSIPFPREIQKIADTINPNSIVEQDLLAQCADCYGHSYNDTPETRRKLFVEQCIRYGLSDETGSKLFEVYKGSMSPSSLIEQERLTFNNIKTDVDLMLKPSNCESLEGGASCIFGNVLHGVRTQTACTACARLQKGQGFLKTPHRSGVL